MSTLAASDAARLESLIEAAFEDRANINAQTTGAVRESVDRALLALDRGELRVAEKIPGKTGREAWKVNQWLKKAVLLSFRLADMTTIPGGPGGASWWDKVPSKFEGWGAAEHAAAGFRSVPNCVVRRSAYVAPGVILMPSFVNLGAYVDSRHDGRHLGDRRLLRADRQECASLGRRRHRRRARAVAGQSDDHRGQLLRRRALGSGRRRHRRRRLGDRHGRVHLRLDQDRRSRRPARSMSAMCRPIRSWSPATCPASRCRAMARPAPRPIAR
jgi:hypothetical protein